MNSYFVIALSALFVTLAVGSVSLRKLNNRIIWVLKS